MTSGTPCGVRHGVLGTAAPNGQKPPRPARAAPCMSSHHPQGGAAHYQPLFAVDGDAAAAFRRVTGAPFLASGAARELPGGGRGGGSGCAPRWVCSLILGKRPAARGRRRACASCTMRHHGHPQYATNPSPQKNPTTTLLAGAASPRRGQRHGSGGLVLRRAALRCPPTAAARRRPSPLRPPRPRYFRLRLSRRRRPPQVAAKASQSGTRGCRSWWTSAGSPRGSRPVASLPTRPRRLPLQPLAQAPLSSLRCGAQAARPVGAARASVWRGGLPTARRFLLTLLPSRRTLTLSPAARCGR